MGMNHKIGLVTVTYVNNYGSHLQSFALQEVVKKIGYMPEIININGVKKEIDKARKKYVCKRIFDIEEMKAYFPKLKKKIVMLINSKYKCERIERNKMFKLFASNYNFSPIVDGWTNLAKYCLDNYESVIVGSDQNWRPANIAGGFYTLGFVPDQINKISYATSFGIGHIVESQKKYAQWFLNRINHLSVRENSGKKIVKDLIGKDIDVVCDPTLLLSKDEWEKFFDKKPIEKEPYIFCYFLGENDKHRLFVKRLKEKTGLRVVAILYGERYYKEKIDFYDVSLNKIGPFEFLNLIKNASFVCTDSFHGCAFSLIFERQLFAFYKFVNSNKMSTNNRLDTMLEWAGASQRIISGDENVEKLLLTPMDYEVVSKKIKSKRSESMNYLKSSLQNCVR